MIKKIFRSILLTALAVLLIGLSITMGSLYYYFEDVQEQQLYSELSLASQAVEESGITYLEKLDTDELRFTLVGADGSVLFDSDADPNNMENHAQREEIREALTTGNGESFRYSSTLTEKTIYRAVRLSDGTVLRVSVSQATVLSLIAGVAPWLILAAFFAAVLSWLLAKRLSKRIISPLNDVDLEHPLDNDTYEELSPILNKIHRQHGQINQQLSLLRQKTEEFEHITSNMREALVLLDANGKILSINPAALSLFGVKGNGAGLDFMAVEHSHTMNRATADAMEKGHASIREERNGRSFQFDISRIEQDGKIMGLVILAVDISEQEYAERNRKEFSANVSHELKTPLTAIIASADLIENNLVKPEDMPRFIGHIKKEASRLMHLIDDIIRLSQLDEGVDLPAEDIDLTAAAQEIAEQLRDTADQRNVQIEVDGSSCMIHGVPRLLHEIIYNLVENAIKYNVPDGTVTVSVKKEKAGCVLQVSDTGIGIPAEHQERVFERFYRVDKSHSKQSGGTGLGLSIVKHAATSFGANIKLQSEAGKGTSITVVFPA